MAQISYNGFPTLNSKVAQASVFSLLNCRVRNFFGKSRDSNSALQPASKEDVLLARESSTSFEIAGDLFTKIPGSSLAYWIHFYVFLT